MIFIYLLLIVSGFLLGMFYMMYEERKLKPFRQAVEKANDEYIKSLENTNEYFRDEANKWLSRYFYEKREGKK